MSTVRAAGTLSRRLQRCATDRNGDMPAIAAALSMYFTTLLATAAQHNSPGLPRANNRQPAAHPRNPRSFAPT